MHKLHILNFSTKEVNGVYLWKKNQSGLQMKFLRWDLFRNSMQISVQNPVNNINSFFQKCIISTQISVRPKS